MKSPTLSGLLALTLLLLPAALFAQQVTISGQVIEPQNATRVGGATVRLGNASSVTGLGGEFRFPNVPPGTYTLRVEALGYRPVEITLNVQRDTTVAISLVVDPVHLEELRVTGNQYMTVDGVVTDAETGNRITDARVFVGPEREAATGENGAFVVNRVPVGYSYAVDVRKLGYLPFRVALITNRDTTFHVTLHPDPVAQQMIARQIEKIEIRSNAVGHAKTRVTRDMMIRNRTHTLYDVLRERVPRNVPIQCFFIDEYPTTPSRDLLETFKVDDLYRVEIIDNGRMVRVYTTRIIDQMVRGEMNLDPIVYVTGGARPVCF